MKKLSRLNSYLKLTIASAMVVFLTAVFNVLFVLLPLYDLAGHSLDADADQQANMQIELDRLTSLNNLTTAVIYAALVIGVISFAIGIYKITRHDTK